MGKDNKRGEDDKMKKDYPVVLKYKGWIIRKDTVGYILHHVNDKKMNHAVYPGSLTYALQLLHEKLLLSKMANNGYDGSLAALKKAIEDTHKEFEELLTPKLLKVIKEEQGG